MAPKKAPWKMFPVFFLARGGGGSFATYLANRCFESKAFFGFPAALVQTMKSSVGHGGLGFSVRLTPQMPRRAPTATKRNPPMSYAAAQRPFTLAA